MATVSTGAPFAFWLNAIPHTITTAQEQLAGLHRRILIQ